MRETTQEILLYLSAIFSIPKLFQSYHSSKFKYQSSRRQDAIMKKRKSPGKKKSAILLQLIFF